MGSEASVNGNMTRFLMAKNSMPGPSRSDDAARQSRTLYAPLTVLPVPLIPDDKSDFRLGPIPNKTLTDSIKVRQWRKLFSPRAIDQTIVEVDFAVC